MEGHGSLYMSSQGKPGKIVECVITFTCCDLFSPGVVITELQKRGGLSEEAYHKVGQ